MDPLNSLENIAELIRRRASASNKLGGEYTDKLGKARQKHALTKQHTAESVKLKIVKAIKAIDINDVRRNQKSMSIFVESVLLWQFGDELINDPNFINLVDEVGSALLKESSILNQLNKLAAS